jgi:hypothetical protein
MWVDLCVETGTIDLAREHYELVVMSCRRQRRRHIAPCRMDQDGVPGADIKNLRQAARSM